jgi:anthranilate synthase component I
VNASVPNPAGEYLACEVAGGAESLRALASAFPDRYPVLLESVAAGTLGHTSVLAGGVIGALWRKPSGTVHASGLEPIAGGFLHNLEHAVRASRAHGAPVLSGASQCVPFASGWLVLLGYELAAEIEPRLRLPPARLSFDALALRTTVALVHRVESDRLIAIGEPNARPAWLQLQRDLQDAAPVNSLPLRAARISEEDPPAYIERVLAAKEHVAAGDVYQANLSRWWRLKWASEPRAMDVYERLRQANPAPFAAAVQWQGVGVVSSSPERLLEIRGREISTRPIAGTRRRTRAPGADAAEVSELVAHPKERAEHVMLIDLERNDLGRVCEGGSVHVDEFMVTESYEHVHHIVSNVRGRLRDDVTPVGALRALFPGGTITGCPKVRCMELIAELEGSARGFYTGSLGYIGLDGNADFNILIRTLTVVGNEIEFRAGAGIVADSVAERELDETRAKARGLLAAFESR